jgi:hypothetical protein
MGIKISKQFLYGIAIILLAGNFSCSNSKWAVGEERVIEGRVYIIGNEPFTRLAINQGMGTQYILLCSKESEAMLRNNQGKYVKIRAQGAEMMPEGFAVKVIDATILSQ